MPPELIGLIGTDQETCCSQSPIIHGIGFSVNEIWCGKKLILRYMVYIFLGVESIFPNQEIISTGRMHSFPVKLHINGKKLK
jgi:hypothetical protein